MNFPDLSLNLFTPEKPLLKNIKINSISLFTKRGEIEILKGHTAYFSLLESGLLKYENSDGKSYFLSINQGYLEVQNSKVYVLADQAKAAEDVDKKQVQTQVENIEKTLDQPAKAEETDELMSQLRYLKAQLEL